MLNLRNAVAAVIIILLSIPTTTSPALANSCSKWSASVAEREEGKALTASVCAPGKERESVLEILCFGNKVNLRYLTVIKNNADPTFPKQYFVFETNESSSRLFMQFEAMDGAFTAYLPPGHRLFELMMGGSKLLVWSTRDRLATPTFTLEGSRRSIGKVISSCRSR